MTSSLREGDEHCYRNCPKSLGGEGKGGVMAFSNLLNFQNFGDFSCSLDLGNLCLPIATDSGVL